MKDNKFISLLSLVIENSNGDKLTELKLHKLLYFAEANYFEKYGNKITNCRFYNNKHGPTPSFPYYKDALKYLVDNRYIEVTSSGYKYFKSVQKYNQSSLTKDEEKIIKKVCKDYFNYTATKLRQESHKDAPYLATENGEEIDFDTVYQRFTDDELKPLKI